MHPIEKKILVVDDMAAMRIRVINQLKTMGYTKIDQASNGKEAYEALEKAALSQQPYDIVISDWNMPEMTGIDFLVKIRSESSFSALPFLMITAEGEKQQVVRALKAGVTDYLIKPVNKEFLEKKLLMIWDKHLSAAA